MKEILFGFPQGSVLEPPFFNIFICDLFSIMKNLIFASYTDDNTPYVIGDGVIQVSQSLQEASDKLLKLYHKK